MKFCKSQKFPSEQEWDIGKTKSFAMKLKKAGEIAGPEVTIVGR
jgi:hypothetical protein